MRRTIFFRLTIFSFFVISGCAKEFEPAFQKAQDAYAKKSYVQAIDAIQEALPLWRDSDGNEKRALAYQTLGLSYQKIQKLDKAIEAYSAALKLSNNMYDSAYNLGSLYLVSGKPTLAAETFKKALGTKKDDPLALLGLGNTYFAQKKYKTARVYYKRIIAISPGVSEALEHIRIVDKKLAPKSSSKKKIKRKTRKRR